MLSIDETASEVNVAERQIHNGQNKPINIQIELKNKFESNCLILCKGNLSLCKRQAESCITTNQLQINLAFYSFKLVHYTGQKQNIA